MIKFGILILWFKEWWISFKVKISISFLQTKFEIQSDTLTNLKKINLILFIREYKGRFTTIIVIKTSLKYTSSEQIFVKSFLSYSAMIFDLSFGVLGEAFESFESCWKWRKWVWVCNDSMSFLKIQVVDFES